MARNRQLPDFPLGDDELVLVAHALLDRDCWRSVCDFACSSRRAADTLSARGDVWHRAAVLYFGGADATRSKVSQLLDYQCDGLRLLLLPPDANPSVFLPRNRPRYYEREYDFLKRTYPLLSQGEYPPLAEADVYACLPRSHGLRAALALLERLDAPPTDRVIRAVAAHHEPLRVLHRSWAADGERQLAAFVGTAGEPFVLALHRTLYELNHGPGDLTCLQPEVCLGGGDGRQPPLITPPLMPCAVELWQPIRLQ
mmetsp:Transcript_35628/g.83143  ORF Transcript_35628/g.83143 Transcript_35628/m.83143 type:complete len:255 (-) Transcript_35628:58-822(-)|eukprot:CAMPEP_0119365456 /NCGR_PEP_ID=MMETSP1334-20130426/12405_1 /TAXON_ID=127549 /ORGANISM="Calcidiscus leptoporus, Strain RCC1130" /LENGTH=254 /DNA_ID=CAMNT_0007381449 /DNA_START=167 /DNA_END=931 /DNA_ORIENTATION=-